MTNKGSCKFDEKDLKNYIKFMHTYSKNLL